MNNSETRDELKAVIGKIKSEMNSKRTNFDLPSSHFNITINWLLGFVEGDGWFSYSVNEKSFVFGIIQMRGGK